MDGCLGIRRPKWLQVASFFIAGKIVFSAADFF